MYASYENQIDIREKVAEIVPTYHPAGMNGTEKKGKAYEEQMREVAATRAVGCRNKYLE